MEVLTAMDTIHLEFLKHLNKYSTILSEGNLIIDLGLHKEIWEYRHPEDYDSITSKLVDEGYILISEKKSYGRCIKEIGLTEKGLERMLKN